MTTILLMGPTAAGKSALALDLAQAFGGEIVSVDSAQVYRGMDVGTAKPDRATRERVPHHLLDLVDPTEPYSAARFVADANAAIGAIRARGRVPIVAGGTMLYFKALTEGLSDLPGADPSIRAEIDRDAAVRGWPALHAELAAGRCGDGGPPRARRRAAHPARARGVPRDRCAAVRAAGPTRRAAARRCAAACTDAVGPGAPSRRRSRSDSTRCSPRDWSTSWRRCNAASTFAPSCRRCARSATGRRGAILEGAIDRAALREAGIAATRQLAKRQITWLRATTATRFDPFDDGAAAMVRETVGRALGA